MTIQFEKLNARLLANPKVKAEYDALAPEFEIAAELLRARLRAGLSQAELAARMGTSQSTIARLENGHTLPSTKTLLRYAEATGSRLHMRLSAAGLAAHQGRIFFAEARQPEGILGQRVSDHRADHVALLHRVQGFEVAPAIGVIQFDLFGCLAPAPRRPVNVGAQPDRFAAGDVGDDLEREAVASDGAL